VGGVPTALDKLNAYKAGLMTQEQHAHRAVQGHHAEPHRAWVQYIVVIGFMGVLIFLLNRWSCSATPTPRPARGSFDKWRVRLENLSGFPLLLYVVAMTDFVIVFIKSLDVTWYSSVYGLQLLVAAGLCCAGAGHPHAHPALAV
jgi:hypothetical protein